MIGKLLCAAAFASAAFAQTISIALPVEGTKVVAGSAMVVQLERSVRVGVYFPQRCPNRSAPRQTPASEDIAIAIGAANCIAGCFDDGLGNDLLYTGLFNPQSKNSAGNLYENITITLPNYFDGTMQLNVAHFYLQGVCLSLSVVS